jgi:hypothetical protein
LSFEPTVVDAQDLVGLTVGASQGRTGQGHDMVAPDLTEGRSRAFCAAVRASTHRDCLGCHRRQEADLNPQLPSDLSRLVENPAVRDDHGLRAVGVSRGSMELHDHRPGDRAVRAAEHLHLHAEPSVRTLSFLPAEFIVSGLVYDVETGLVEQVVGPELLRNDRQDATTDQTTGSAAGQS